MNDKTLANMVGETITAIEGCERESDLIAFKLASGGRFELYHGQDCCESVSVEDVCGDLADLIGSPLVLAEEVCSDPHGDEPPKGEDWPPPPDGEESYTWTFYRLATARGLVTIRWFGTSNGYYSESVDFAYVPASESSQ